MSRNHHILRVVASFVRQASCETTSLSRVRLAPGDFGSTFASTPTRPSRAPEPRAANVRALSVRTFASDVVSADSDADAPSTSGEGNRRKDLYMMFTCGRCETRAVRGFSRQAYENGVVIVTCPGCLNKHVVADRMGWFGEPGSVEDFITQAAGKGTSDVVPKVVLGSVTLEPGNEDGTLEINTQELEAWKLAFTAPKAR